MLIWGEKAVENCKQRDDTTNFKKTLKFILNHSLGIS